MSSRCSLSPPMSVFACSRRLLVLPSRPSNAAPSSSTMGCNWPTPPPLSSSDNAPRTCSISVAWRVRSSGIRSPSASFAESGPDGGADSWMNFSPSRLVCSTAAIALAGRSTDESRMIPTSAVHPSGPTDTSSTRPTGTPSTFTVGLRNQVQDIVELNGQVHRIGTHIRHRREAEPRRFPRTSRLLPRSGRRTVRRRLSMNASLALPVSTGQSR